MKIITKFDRGQTVYLKTDPDQYPRIVTRFLIGDEVQYELAYVGTKVWHYEIEISTEKDMNQKLNIT